MESRSSPVIPCALCSKPVNLQIDLYADENGKPVHEECYVNRLVSARANQTWAENLHEMLSAEPAVLRCPKCGAALWQADATFLTKNGKSWMIPLPICASCSRDADTARYMDS
jgi:hypothetical protein